MKFLKNLKRQISFYRIKDSKDLVEYHFKNFSEHDHINKNMFLQVLKNFRNKSINILETGSSAWGTNSSILFDNYVKKFGGSFVTVDIREEPSSNLNKVFSNNSKAFVDDSVNFIKNYDKTKLNELNLIYLDSYDLDLDNPEPSMQHGLNEFLLIDSFIDVGTVIAIDDTPISLELFGQEVVDKYKENKDFLPGKGTYVLEHINKKNNYEVIYHHYSLVIKKTK